MNAAFWLLSPPRNQQRATVAGDTKFEEITCPSDDGHLRAGRRLGDLRVTVDPAGFKDVTWTWSHDMLASERLLDVFLKHRITGFEIRPVTVSYSERSPAKRPAMHELIITGWGGMASTAAKLTVAESCPVCNYTTYAIAEPSRLIDLAAWDGSDLFIVWPLPRFPFASERLANILREEKITGVKLIPAPDIPFKRGNHATPGRLLNWMPAGRAHALGDRLGIN
jgi:hypothetical protein